MQCPQVVDNRNLRTELSAQTQARLDLSEKLELSLEVAVIKTLSRNGSLTTCCSEEPESEGGRAGGRSRAVQRWPWEGIFPLGES